MTDSIEAKSIEKSLKIIRKALQEENNTSNLFEENALLLNQLVKDDGTVAIIEDKNINKDEIKEILNDKLSAIFDEHLEKWLDKNIPNYIDKFLSKKK